MIVYLLFLFAIGNNDTHPDVLNYKVFKTETECKAAQIAVNKTAIIHGYEHGSVTCTPIKLGDFS